MGFDVAFSLRGMPESNTRPPGKWRIHAVSGVDLYCRPFMDKQHLRHEACNVGWDQTASAAQAHHDTVGQTGGPALAALSCPTLHTRMIEVQEVNQIEDLTHFRPAWRDLLADAQPPASSTAWNGWNVIGSILATGRGSAS